MQRLSGARLPNVAPAPFRAGTLLRRKRSRPAGNAATTVRTGELRRRRRGGYAFAEGAFLHGKAPERHWVAERRRVVAWSVLPIAAATALSPFGGAALLVLLVYPLQVMRLAAREGMFRQASWEDAVFTVLAKFPEAIGVAEFCVKRYKGGSVLIEYK